MSKKGEKDSTYVGSENVVFTRVKKREGLEDGGKRK